MDINTGPLHETMRIAGERVRGTDDRIAVRNPWNGKTVGTVPCAGPDDVERALVTARGYRARLTRAQRAEILERAAALVVARSGADSNYNVTLRWHKEKDKPEEAAEKKE